MNRVVLSLVLIGLAGRATAADPVAANPAAADPVAADRAAAEADALAGAGRFAAAAAKFREAWQADRLRPELFCNIGIAYYKAKDLVRAHLLLGECLEQAALDPKFVDAARSALASVEAVLRGAGHAPVRIAVEPAATAVAIAELAPDGEFVGSRLVWLPFGSYHVSAHAEGYADATEVVSAATAEPRTVTIALHRPAADAVPPRDLPGASPPGPGPGPGRLPAYLATAGTVVAIGVAGVAYVEGHARADLGASALDAETLAADQHAVTRWNTALVIAGSVAIVGAAASGYLWYRALRGARVELHAGPTGGGVSLSGRF